MTLHPVAEYVWWYALEWMHLGVMMGARLFLLCVFLVGLPAAAGLFMLAACLRR